MYVVSVGTPESLLPLSEALGEGEGTEMLGGNAGSDFVGSSLSPAPLCETSLCLPGSVANEDGRRTSSQELVWGGAGAELPATLDAWVSDTGSVLSPPLVAVTELGVLVTEALGRCPPVAEVPSGEALSKADGEPVSNGPVDDTVAPLPPPPGAPKEDRVWPGEPMVSVPVVDISVVWGSLVLAGRDLNVLPPPLVAVAETEVLVVGKFVLLSVDRRLNDTRLLPVAGEGPSEAEREPVSEGSATRSVKSVISVDPRTP